MPKTCTNCTATRSAPHLRAGRLRVLLKIAFWRLATLPFRVPSPQPGLTAVFGMRTGVTPAINHQNAIFNELPLKRRAIRKLENNTRLPQFLSRVLSAD